MSENLYKTTGKPVFVSYICIMEKSSRTQDYIRYNDYQGKVAQQIRKSTILNRFDFEFQLFSCSSCAMLN
jgi:hypothetical protein